MARDDLGTPHLRFERDGSVARCVIDRPERRNALTPAMYFGIRKAVEIVEHDPALAVLVITGTGDTFAPGGEMAGRFDDDRSAQLGGLLGTDVLPFERIRDSAKPVISAVNGTCQGGRLLIAMLSDIAIASDRATFRIPELLRGVADVNYATYLVPHVGIARARDLIFTARRFDAQEAVEMGLIARVVAHDELEAATHAVIADVVQGAPEARRQLKRIVNSAYGRVDRMTFEASVFGDEAAEGFAAFAEKRPPSWVPEDFRRDGRL